MTSSRRVVAIALLISLGLWIPASFASACDACGEFSGAQAVARVLVAFSPMWLLLLAGLAVRFRAILQVLFAALVVMTAVTIALATDLRASFAPLGLSSARGFIAYSIPFAVAALAVAWELRRGRSRPLTEPN